MRCIVSAFYDGKINTDRDMSSTWGENSLGGKTHSCGEQVEFEMVVDFWPFDFTRCDGIVKKLQATPCYTKLHQVTPLMTIVCINVDGFIVLKALL